MLPNFFVIGSMKSGTTSLWFYLQAHPQVFMSRPKEPNYFCTQESFDTRRGWYEELFREAGDAVAIGEASTGYTKYPTHQGVPARIAALVPDARLIYLIRDPIERIRSQYLHVRRHAHEHRPIREALIQNPNYVNYSSYWKQLQQYLEWFPRDRVLVLESETLLRDRVPTLRRVSEFLSIDPAAFSDNIDTEFHQARTARVHRPAFRRVSSSRPYRAAAQLVPDVVRSPLRRFTSENLEPETVQIPDDVRRSLEDAVRDDVAELRGFLGPDFHGWGLA